MGLPVEVNPLFLENQYAIQRSLRFRASATAFLTRTPGGAGSSTTYTWSGWVKLGYFNVGYLMSATGNSGYRMTGWYLRGLGGSGALEFEHFDGTTTYNLTTSAVFRDPSSWYHIIIAVDSTQGTNTNRTKIYVNGVQQTVTGTYLGSSTSTYINTTNIQSVGRSNNTSAGSGGYFDGYMSEVNFIDGYPTGTTSGTWASDNIATLFGQYNEFGVWSPRKYGGSYGTNGFYLPFTAPNVSSYSGAFNGSNQYLQATLPATLTGAFTVEYFLNRGTSGNQFMFTLGDSATSTGLEVYIGSSGTVLNALWSGSSQITATGNTTAIPVSSWNHLAVTRDSSNNVRLFLNGQQVGSTVTNSNAINNTLRIGVEYFTSSILGYLNGSLSNFRIINGTCLYTSNYSVPAAPLTAVSGTSILTLQSATVIDNSANALTITNNNSVTMSVATPWSNYIAGQDSSGNGNSWASNNINVTSLGTTYDAMTDVPPPSTIQNVAAGNYATLNPLNNYSTTTISNGNLTAAFGASSTVYHTSVAGLFVNSGKWYFEATPTSNGSSDLIGVVGPTVSCQVSSLIGGGAAGGNDSYGYFGINGNKRGQGTTDTAYGSTFTTNDIIGVALDLDNGAIYFAKNNTWQNSGVPTSGSSKTGAAFTSISGYYTAAVGDGATNLASTVNLNCGQQPFSYTPPSGFLPLNSNNLPAPTIPNGAKVMAATTYTGTGSTNQIYNSANNTLGVTFKPDFVWIRNRPDASGGMWLDSVRGTSVFLQTTNSNGDATNTGDFVSFNNDGFTVGGNGNLANLSTKGFVGWNWNAGSGSSTVPTGGTITPTGASINVSAGFSIITYTAPVGTSTDTIPHGLGVAPSFIIVKCRVTSAVYNSWGVYHSSLGATKYLELNTTGAAGTASTWWNNTAPTASVFSVGSQFLEDNSTYVAYCWTPIAGYSSMGSYTGNGSADGPFIFTNMRPRWLMIKRTDVAGENWYLYDTSRDTYNVMQNTIQPNLVNAESGSSARYFDLLSNGFKVRNSDTAFNGSGSTYIYVAFAENPFKLALAR